MRNPFMLLALAGTAVIATMGPASIGPATIVMATIIPTAHAADTVTSSDGPDLRAIRADLKAKKYDVALTQLRPLAEKYQQPDVYSLMGFALRKTGDRPNAMIYYNKALTMNPGHKGALEYQGELFVELGQMDNARANLARLRQICLFGCEEYNDLKEAIEHAPKRS
jgi:tetratricopeptide (TPR) repeat protein